MNVEKIVQMLSCNQPDDIQQNGIELAIKEHDLQYLLYYSENPEFGDNISQVFSALPYEKSKKYMYDLFSWIENINSVGAERILCYLKRAPANIIYEEFLRTFLSLVKRKNFQSFESLLLIWDENLELQVLIKEKNLDVFNYMCDYSNSKI